METAWVKVERGTGTQSGKAMCHTKGVIPLRILDFQHPIRYKIRRFPSHILLKFLPRDANLTRNK